MSWLSIALLAAAGLVALTVYRIIPAFRYALSCREMPGLLTPEECEYLIKSAKGHLRASPVYDDLEGGKRGGDAYDERRNSNTAFLDHRKKDRRLRKIVKKVADMIDVPHSHFETPQVLRYRVGQEYQAHYDYIEDQQQTPSGPRECTVIVYLNEGFNGGGTEFPYIFKTFEPAVGKGVYFLNLNKDGSDKNFFSFHAGCKVEEGEKWLVNFWIRRAPFFTGQ